jgi:A/G-specific adenine glycosylase
MHELRAALLTYYDAQKRDLPWRHRHDPYGIWLSEIMLQQTQVETVRERYLRFLAEFPDVEALAAAREERVCEAWAGLGYYRRARNLHRAARVIVHDRGGAWPRTAAELEELPGVGRYTARAVASIAFGEEVASVDGNLTRVLARLFALPGRVGERALATAVEARAARLITGPRPGDVNQALMDLGATLCAPAQPRCSACPVSRWCAAREAGDPTVFPGAKRAVETRVLPVALAWLEDGQGVYLRRRPLDGLWAGLWELPSAEGRGAAKRLAADLGAPLGRPLVRVEHVLTHRRVVATVYPVRGAPGRGLVPYADPLAAPLSGLARRAIEAVQRARLRD